MASAVNGMAITTANMNTPIVMITLSLVIFGLIVSPPYRSSFGIYPSALVRAISPHSK
jgi:hypothetical protein